MLGSVGWGVVFVREGWVSGGGFGVSGVRVTMMVSVSG